MKLYLIFFIAFLVVTLSSCFLERDGTKNHIGKGDLKRYAGKESHLLKKLHIRQDKPNTPDKSKENSDTKSDKLKSDCKDGDKSGNSSGEKNTNNDPNYMTTRYDDQDSDGDGMNENNNDIDSNSIVKRSTVINMTLTYNGETVTVDDVQKMIEKLIEQDILNDGSYVDGIWTWNPDFEIDNLVQRLVVNYGGKDSYWSTIIHMFPHIIKVYPSLVPNSSQNTPNEVPSNIISMSFTYNGQTETLNDVQKITEDLIEQDILYDGRNDDGLWTWNSDLDINDLIEQLLVNYGGNESYWSMVIHIFPQIVKDYPFLIPNSSSYISTEIPAASDEAHLAKIDFKANYNGHHITVHDVAKITQELIEQDILSEGRNDDGDWTWNPDFDANKLAQRLVANYGVIDSYWLMVIDVFPQIVKNLTFLLPNSYRTTPNEFPITMRVTYDGQTKTLNDVQKITEELIEQDILNDGKNDDGYWTWNPDFDMDELIRRLAVHYGGDESYWYMIIHAFPQIVQKYPFLVQNSYPDSSNDIPIVPHLIPQYLPNMTITYNGKTVVITDTDMEKIVKELIEQDVLNDGRIDDGDWTWNPDFDMDELITQLVLKYGDEAPYWSTIIHLFPQIVKDYPLLVPNSSPTPPTKIPTSSEVNPSDIINMTITYDSQPVTIPDVRKITEELIEQDVLNDGRIDDGYWTWNPNFNVDELVRQLVENYGGKDSYWSMIIHVFPQIVKDYPFMIPNSSPTTLTYIPTDTEVNPSDIINMTVTYDSQPVTIPDVRKITEELIEQDVLNDGRIDDGYWTWNPNFNVDELVRQLIENYGGEDSYWSMIIHVFPQIVKDYPFMIPNSSPTTLNYIPTDSEVNPSDIINMTVTYDSQPVTIPDVRKITEELIEQDVLNDGRIDDGYWTWNPNFNVDELVRQLIENYGGEDSYWSMIIHVFPQIVKDYPFMIPNSSPTTLTYIPTDTEVNPSDIINMTVTYDSQPVTIPDVRKITEELIEQDVLNDGRIDDGYWTWNPNFNVDELVRQLIENYGGEDSYWSMIIHVFPQIVKDYPFMIPNSSPTTLNYIPTDSEVNPSDIINMTVTYDSQPVTIPDVRKITEELIEQDVLNDGRIDDGYWTWNPNFNVDELVRQLIENYGGEDSYWSMIIHVFPQIVKDYPFMIPNSSPTTLTYIPTDTEVNPSDIINMTVTYDSQPVTIPDVRKITEELIEQDVLNDGRIDDGYWTWNPNFNVDELVRQLVENYGGEDSYWSMISHVFPQIVKDYPFLIQNSSPNSPTEIPGVSGVTYLAIINMKVTYDGQPVTINDVQKITEQLIEQNVLKNGRNIDGYWTWIPDFDLEKMVRQLVVSYGGTDSYWSMIINVFPEIVRDLPFLVPISSPNTPTEIPTATDVTPLTTIKMMATFDGQSVTIYDVEKITKRGKFGLCRCR